jgi:hypothetical protein
MTKIEKLHVVLMTILTIAIIAASASGQVPDDVLYAQAKADALMQATLAQAASPGPPSRGTLTAAAPASGDYYERLAERVKALEDKIGNIGRSTSTASTGSYIALTAAQETRLDAVERELAACLKMARELPDKIKAAQSQPSLAAPQAKDHVCDCGPNCRCVGQCNCRWAGECLGVPDSRVQRSVVTQPATTVRVLRTYPATTYRGNGSVGGYSSGYYSSPSYSSGYSSSYGTPVYCVDSMGNPVPCN